MSVESTKLMLHSIFIHPLNNKRSIRFYSGLLGVNVAQGTYEGSLYSFRMAEGVNLLLTDIRSGIRNAADPACMFVTDELELAFECVVRQRFEIIQKIEQGVNFRYFIWRDQEGHVFVTGSGDPQLPGADAVAGSVPICGIRSFRLYARKPEKASAAFSVLTGIPAFPEGTIGSAYTIPMKQGMAMCWQDQTNENEAFLCFHTNNMSAAYDHLKQMGVSGLRKFTSGSGSPYWLFEDPDGLLLLVSEHKN